MQKNTITAVVIILLVIVGLGAGFSYIQNQSSSKGDQRNSKATSTNTTSSQATTTGEVEKLKQKAKKKKNLVDLFKKGNLKFEIDEPENLKSTLQPWINSWQSVYPNLSLADFQLQRQSKFAFPFNEVSINESRQKQIPWITDTFIPSPNGQMGLSYLFHYHQEPFSGAVLRNPNGEDRLYRVAFCNNFCRYHFADWLSNTQFVTASIQEDIRSCEEGTSFSECPETLSYTIYDLESMVATHYTYKDTLGQIKANHFPQAICGIYAPCGSRNQ